ncbi:MAG: hypothetical protein LC769_03475 [Chloroflexi bacterium]|nr:hypothetical protein [Chloroflexota bacterium]
MHCDSLSITATIAVPLRWAQAPHRITAVPAPLSRAGQTLTLVTALFTGATPVSTTTTSAAGA